jgi:hypothetical protein
MTNRTRDKMFAFLQALWTMLALFFIFAPYTVKGCEWMVISRNADNHISAVIFIGLIGWLALMFLHDHPPKPKEVTPKVK